MKKVCILLFILAAPLLVAATSPRTGKLKARQARSLGEQVNAYLAYPELLKKRNAEGIVVIQFRVDEENRLGKLQVYSGNEELNADLTRQLTGRKIYLADSTPFDTHTVRLHFQSPSTK